MKGDVSNALSAGISNVDVYIFPDTNLDPSSSMQTLVNNMKNDGVLTKNMIWYESRTRAGSSSGI